jgi:hypothetical protein
MTRSAIVNCLQLTKRLLDHGLMRLRLIDGGGAHLRTLMWGERGRGVRDSGVTTWSRALLEKLTVPRLVNKYPAFYGTRRFIAAFTKARHIK